MAYRGKIGGLESFQWLYIHLYFCFFCNKSWRILNIVEEHKKIAISFPYKWHSILSCLTVRQRSISNNDFHVLKQFRSASVKSIVHGLVSSEPHGVFVTYIFSPDNILLFSEYDFFFFSFSSCFSGVLVIVFLLDDTERVAQTKPYDPQHKHFLLHTFHQVISAYHHL